MKKLYENVTVDDAEPFTFYSFLYVFDFHLFSNIFKAVFRPSHIWFCREFQALSFDKKSILI